MCGQVRIVAIQRLPAIKVFGGNGLAVRCEDKLRFLLFRFRGIAQRGEARFYSARLRGKNMDVCPLQHRPRYVCSVRRAFAEAVQRCVFVAKGFEELEREFSPIKWLNDQIRYGFLYFNSVHFSMLRDSAT